MWKVLVWFATGSNYVSKSGYVSRKEAEKIASGYSDAAAVRIENDFGSWEQIKGNSNMYPGKDDAR